MKHFAHYSSPEANFVNPYAIGLQNIIMPKAEKEAKKYVRRKKEEQEAEKE